MLFLAALLAAQQGWSAEPIRFPVLTGEDLNKTEVRLPEAFGTGPARVILGFTKASGDALKRCADELDAAPAGKPPLYRLAVLEGVPFFLKGLIKSKIRESVTEAVKPRYFVLTEGKDELKRVSAYDEATGEDHAYILRLENGAVVERTHSACAAAK